MKKIIALCLVLTLAFSSASFADWSIFDEIIETTFNILTGKGTNSVGRDLNFETAKDFLGKTSGQVLKELDGFNYNYWTYEVQYEETSGVIIIKDAQNIETFRMYYDTIDKGSIVYKLERNTQLRIESEDVLEDVRYDIVTKKIYDTKELLISKNIKHEYWYEVTDTDSYGSGMVHEYLLTVIGKRPVRVQGFLLEDRSALDPHISYQLVEEVFVNSEWFKSHGESEG